MHSFFFFLFGDQRLFLGVSTTVHARYSYGKKGLFICHYIFFDIFSPKEIFSAYLSGCCSHTCKKCTFSTLSVEDSTESTPTATE
uniref:Putative secreted protein n=1 Tax=Ixodes ricinus TaxID=34613 RepID=A0A6B0UES8_IXORI